MHTEDSDYLLMTLPYHPVHDLKKHFITGPERAHLHWSSQASFAMQLAQHEPSYPRYVLDFKTHNKEMVPIFVSSLNFQGRVKNGARDYNALINVLPEWKDLNNLGTMIYDLCAETVVSMREQ